MNAEADTTGRTGADGRRSVAVVSTVLNEGRSIRDLLETLQAQTRRPDEVIFVDGGSTDETVQIIRSYAGRLPVTVLLRPGVNIAAGRNIAIAAARSEIIAATDAGVRLACDWLQTLVEPFETDQESSAPGVVCGFFLPDPRTVFEVAMGATILPRSGEIDPHTFLPSSRSVAFLREAWSRWPYPEWLDYCEDLVFDMGLRAMGHRFVFRPGALARFRPRPDLRAFFRQYFRYARGDGKADLWRKRHAVRYATYFLGLPGLVTLSVVHSPWWLLALVAGGMTYLWTPYRRLGTDRPRLSPAGWIEALALVPVIRVVGDVAKMAGYPVGVVWRQRHKREPGVRWREELRRASLHQSAD